MPTAVQAVVAATSPECHSHVCYDSGCGLSLTGLSDPYILLNLESDKSPVDKTKRHCDFLLVGMPNRAGTEWVVPIELTRNQHKTAEYSVEQLSGGSATADKLLPRRANVRIKGVVGQRGLHRYEFDLLRKMRVPFRGRCGRIRILSCGDDLLNAFG